MRLRSTLVLLVVAAVLPVAVFAMVVSVLLIRHQESAIMQSAQERNRAFLSAVDAEIRGEVDTLQSLASSERLARGDYRGFHREAARLLASQPNWANIILHAPDGRHLVSARVPYGTPLLSKVVDEESFDRVRNNLGVAVGDVFLSGSYDNQPAIPVRLAIVQDHALRYVLTVVIRPARFQALVERQSLSPQGAAGLIDSKGKYVARIPLRPIGTYASNEFISHIRESPEGWYRGTTLEGADIYTAYARSDVSGWTIGFGIPASQLLTPSRRASALLGAGVLLSLAAALFIALRLGERIAGPISQLSERVSTLGTSATHDPVTSRIKEVEHLSQALIRASETLRDREQALRTADRNKSDFLALLSHELRNPLAPLYNGLLLIKMSSEKGHAGADVVSMMERQIHQLSRLIDDLLDITRIDRGKLELRRERLSLPTVIRTATETARPNIEQKRHELVIRHAREPIFVEGDLVRLSQVLGNLLNNAAKFTPDGGRIEVAVDVNGDQALIRVTDNGIGLKPEDTERIFGMFVQVDRNYSQAAGGLGLGLTLARRITELHGGSISAKSAGAGQGTTFELRLPLAPAPIAQATLRQVVPATSGRRRILVVDDNIDAATSLERLLAMSGNETRCAFSPAEALRVAQEFHPHAVVLDLNMPDMDGVMLAEVMRAQPWGADVAFIAVTGMGQPADQERTRKAGFRAHFIKPVNVGVITAELAGLTAAQADLSPPNVGSAA